MPDLRIHAALLLGAALALGACRQDRCKEASPAFQVDVILPPGADGQRVKDLVLQIEAAGLHRDVTLDVKGRLDDSKTSLVVEVGPPGSPGFSVEITATARDAAGGELAHGHATFRATGDACNFFALPTATKNVTDAALEVSHQDVLRPLEAGGPGWVRISKRTFTMGSPASELCRRDDETQHPVTLTRDFEIQRTEVTTGMFKTAMGYDPSTNTCAEGGDTCPVEMVSWHEAAAYCNALSQEAGLTSCYTCASSVPNVTCQEATSFSGQKTYDCPGYRLPTEAEWELAYRAGTTTAYYSGPISSCTGTDSGASAIGWNQWNAASNKHGVALKLPNPWGLYDMAGNVQEWIHDAYSDLGSGPVMDPCPPPPAVGHARVLRGGSLFLGASLMRAACRNSTAPQSRTNEVGFRCCRTLQ